MSWVYSDYLDVRKDFIPVFTEEQDRKEPTSWKSFIPHEGMRDILQKLLKALERGSPSDRLSLWIHGAYGTGKTFAVFVLKHLLEDNLEEVEDYLLGNQKLGDLWPRLKALRERGNCLVIYRSASAHITSPLRLLAEIQQAVKEQLRLKSYSENVDMTVTDLILDKLSHPESSFDWQKAFEKYRGEFVDFSSSDSVINRLRQGDVDLSARVAKVLEDEHVLIMDNPQVLKTWLKEVIRENKLQAIFFMWDEFTDFFINNAATTYLQEIAQATAEFPFYLLLVTHRSLDQLQRMDPEIRRKISERFLNFHFEMKTVTAYQLVGNAIRIKNGAAEEWESRKISLWGRIEKITTSLVDEGTRKEDFKGVIPIHPYSAFLLATISRQFSSSQRTLFRFLKEEEENTFLQFLRDYPRADYSNKEDDWLWLTADALWDYFFRDDNPELTDRVRDILGHYRSRVDGIVDENERKVFKVLMLLMALWRQMPGEDLLRPTRTKVKMIFEGTPLAERIEEIATAFSERGYIHSIAAGFNDEEFTIPLISIDQRRLDNIRRHLEESSPFESLVRPGQELGKGLTAIFNLSGSSGRRQYLIVVSAKELKNKRERVEPVSIEPYQIGVVIIVCLDEEQVAEAERLCSEIATKGKRGAYVVVQAPFGVKRWEQFLHEMARCKYCEDTRDATNGEFYRKRAQDIRDGWLKNVKQGRQKIYFHDTQTEITDIQGYEKQFQQMVIRIFPFGPERISSLSTLYSNSYGKVAAEIGLGVGGKYTKQYQDLMSELNSWEDQGGASKNPEHPLSRMRQVIDSLFEGNEAVHLSRIWEEMREAPYGVIPSLIGMALMGFLLKEYGQGYYWSDGPNCFPLNHNKLAELIEKVLKQIKGHGDIVIRKMTPEDGQFCQLVREIFDLSSNDTGYPEETRKALRIYLSRLSYPLWSLRYGKIETLQNRSSAEDALQGLDAILNVADENGTGLNKTQIQSLVNALEESKETLAAVVRKDEFEEGMRRFIQQQQPSLPDVMGQLGVDLQTTMSRLRLLMNEEVWLWKEEKVADRLPELRSEFELIHSLNQLCGIKTDQLSDAAKFVGSRWVKKAGKLPLRLVAEARHSTACDILRQLCELTANEIRQPQQKLELAQQLKTVKEDVRKALGDQVTVLRLWVKSELDLELSQSEAEELYTKLPDLSQEAGSDQARKIIQAQIELLGKSKLIENLHSQWRELTGSLSPRDWSKKYQVPIQWLLEGSDYLQLFESLHHPDAKSEDELERNLDLMEEHRAELQQLNEDGFTDERFMMVVAADYRDLIGERAEVKALKEYLQRNLKGEVFDWPFRMNEVARAVKTWIHQYYKKEAYHRVIQRIDAMPELHVKNLLKKLAADPMLGALLVREGSGLSGKQEV